MPDDWCQVETKTKSHSWRERLLRHLSTENEGKPLFRVAPRPKAAGFRWTGCLLVFVWDTDAR